MAQFDVFENSNPATRDRIPYLVDLQNSLLSELPTRVVAPLYVAGEIAVPGPKRLCPRFEIEGRMFTLHPFEMAGIPVRLLGRKIIALADRRADLVGAVDAVIGGV